MTRPRTEEGGLPMPNAVPDLTPTEELRLWEEASRRLSRVDTSPTVSMHEVDQVLAKLPASVAREDLIDRLRRMTEPGDVPGAPFAVIQLDELGDGRVLLDDTAELRRRLLRFSVAVANAANDARFASNTDVPRLAAADSESEATLPEPELALESADGRFRLRIRQLQGKVQIAISALGLAVDEVAGCRVGLFASTGDDSGEI